MGLYNSRNVKLRHTGFGQHVAGWVVSDTAGYAKPEPAIVQLASGEAGQPLDGAWMVGDSADSDIADAHKVHVPGDPGRVRISTLGAIQQQVGGSYAGVVA